MKKISLTVLEVKYLKHMVSHDETIRLENLEGCAHGEYQEEDGDDHRQEDIKYAKAAGSIYRKLSAKKDEAENE